MNTETILMKIVNVNDVKNIKKENGSIIIILKNNFKIMINNQKIFNDFKDRILLERKIVELKDVHKRNRCSLRSRKFDNYFRYLFIDKDTQEIFNIKFDKDSEIHNNLKKKTIKKVVSVPVKENEYIKIAEKKEKSKPRKSEIRKCLCEDKSKNYHLLIRDELDEYCLGVCQCSNRIICSNETINEHCDHCKDQSDYQRMVNKDKFTIINSLNILEELKELEPKTVINNLKKKKLKDLPTLGSIASLPKEISLTDSDDEDESTFVIDEYDKEYMREYYEYIFVLRMTGLPVELIKKIRIFRDIFLHVEELRKAKLEKGYKYDYYNICCIERELDNLNEKLQ